MKSRYIILLCIMLLIQGISQAYTAQMMTANATQPPQPMMAQMPCHDMAGNMAMTMDNCCDQDCQCQMMASAMVMSGMVLDHKPDASDFVNYASSSFSAYANNLYRPPITA